MPQPLPGSAWLHQCPDALPSGGMLMSLQHIEQLPQFRPGTARASIAASSARCCGVMTLALIGGECL
jgi:hypothetical protein